MRPIMNTVALIRRIAFCMGFLLPLAGWSQTQLGSAAALQAKFASVQGQLDKNAFGRPLVLQSAEASGQLSGNIFAVVNHPFDEVSTALAKPPVWCDILMLHLNTKNCAVNGSGDATTLQLAVGRKFDQPLSDTQRLDFNWKPATQSADYLSVSLSADKGPLSTRDYRIQLEATPIAGNKTFIHMAYAYAYGTAAKIALQGYLSTIGSDKVGFSTDGKDASGQPNYVGGVRGVVERNTMRYYLAIDAYLDSPSSGQLDKRFGAWFDATEQYARQLHEMSREDYIAMKNNEYKQQPKGQ